MAKTNLLKEAIADAKAVRETALANAKIALEEAFTPRIQSMLSAKLSEEEGIDDEPVGIETEDMAPEEEPVVADTNEEEIPEAPVEEEMDEPEMEEDMEPADDTNEDLELEAILRELEEDPAEEAPAPTEEALDSSDIGDGDNKVDSADDHTEDPGEDDLTEGEHEEEDTNEDVSLDEIIKALQEEEHDDSEEKEDIDETADEKDKDLEEAYSVIKFLKSKINEVNLLNAKLLFSNKLFKNHSLNEGQKMKVIENFDRAHTLREVKLVFATLSESFSLNTSRTKRTIKESYASKSSASTAPKKVISEGNELAARWKKLANL